MDEKVKIQMKDLTKAEKQLREELKETCIKITINDLKGEEVSIFVKGAKNQSDALLAINTCGHLLGGKGGVIIVFYDDTKSMQIEKVIPGNKISEFVDRKTGFSPIDFLGGNPCHLKANQLPPVDKNIEGADNYFQYYKDHIEGRTKLLVEKMHEMEEDFKAFSKEIHGGLSPVKHATMDPLGSITYPESEYKTEDSKSRKKYILKVFSGETSCESDVTLSFDDNEAKAAMGIVEQLNNGFENLALMLQLVEDSKNEEK